MALTKIKSHSVAVNSLTVANIADNAIDATKIASNSILTRHIDDAQITTDQILDGTIATADIADDAVTSAKLDTNIDIAGTLGIGETDPETSLHIKNSGNSFLTLERSGTTGGTGKFGINMEGGSSQQTTMAYDDGGKLVIGRSSDPATQAGFSNDFVLDSSGNFGIGVTPTDYFSGGNNLVVGTGTGEGGITLASSATDQWNYILFADGTSGDAQYRGQVAYNHSTDQLALTSSGYVTILTGSGRSEKVRIDSSGDVRLAANATGAALLKGVSGDQTSRNVGGYPQFTFVGNEGTGMRRPITNILAFDTSGDERMRIDDSGNVLVGKTATGIATVGAELKPTGELLATVSADACAFLNRKTSDGDIAVFRKDNTTVGSIGTINDSLYIASTYSTDSGLRFSGSTVHPCDTSGNPRDAAINLGYSAGRFQHLYFSGGLYGGSEVQLSNLGLGTVQASASVGHTASENEGVFWHSSKGDYAIYRTSGAWSSPNYSQLKLDWDTGIILDGGTSYGKSGVHIHGNISMGDSTYSNFTSPNYAVHIVGDGTALAVESGTGEAYMGSQNTSYFHFLGNRTFYFGNRCEASGGFHTYSDENLKKEITPITGALNNIAKMNGVTFKWKDAEKRGGGDTGKQFGVTAQNMLEVDSELPTLNKDPLASQDEIDNKESTDYYTMDYNRITPFLIEAVKELKTKLEAAEARIKTLES